MVIYLMGYGGFILERTVLREKIVNNDDYFERIKIGVLPTCKGAGATLIATSLAKLISENKNVKVSFVEITNEKNLGSKYTFDSLGMDKRFAGRSFADLFDLIKSGTSIRGITNIDEGINWILHKPNEAKSSVLNSGNTCKIMTMENLRVVNNAPGDIIVCDFEINSECGEFLMDVDALLVVIDPIPSSLIAGYEMISYCKVLERNGRKVFWIINKDNKGVNKKELNKFIKLKELYYIPLINTEEIYSAEYNCMLPISNREARSKIQIELKKIIKSIFG
jgi:CO dehydrogenase nickel-insertion accessory protein CooC1